MTKLNDHGLYAGDPTRPAKVDVPDTTYGTDEERNSQKGNLKKNRPPHSTDVSKTPGLFS